MNFLFHTLSLTSSGGSRVITNLSNYLAEEGHKVAIVIDRNRVAFPLHENVKVYHLKNFSLKDVTPVYQGDTQHFQQHLKAKSEKKAKNKLKLREKYPFIQKINDWKKYLLKLFSFPSKYLVMRKFMSEFKPDKIASHNMYYFLEHYFFYPKDKFSVVLHNSPNQVFLDRGVQSLIPLKLIFKNRHCISVSQGVHDEMLKLYPDISNKSIVIYNPIDIDEIRRKANEHAELPDSPYIITVSSLAPGKRVERTIKAFQKLEREDLLLLILGEGSERDKLESLTKELNLTDRVIFKGFVENPLPFMKGAELMSFTSDYEGFGQVIVECLATGTPVVSTNCPHGPSEILTLELSRFLVDIDNINEIDIVNDLKDKIDLLLLSHIDIQMKYLDPFNKKTSKEKWKDF
ncbi:glycosyltransferase [Vibrio vulnificus]|uniref:Glycosyltransferase n=2 Tax=Vibrio vulnificus TaxID=672 RepID=A0A8H9THM9_VIBVL|nr:glycosyltransferase [Vibrio vulnificus]EHD2242489.1 glycosyltransferase [Vibrio vulnificus]EHU5004837.1 glycosyltransferase [Vibrio vulnificus]EIZ1007295.1 glycosyltransferase [Vibrio vulnificus]EIZ1172999.1 glycosyltransferase [Vibrio vulnificus]EJE8533099.1 glycosyltransferase [Vibrio vulnificus]